MTLTSKARRQLSGFVAATGSGTPGVPALFTRMVTSPSSAAHRLEAGRDRVLVGHVHPHGDGGAAEGGDLSCHGDDLLLRAGGEGHGGAFSGEEAGRRRPDAAPRAGHERHAAGVRSAFTSYPVAEKKRVVAVDDPISHPRNSWSLRLAYPT